MTEANVEKVKNVKNVTTRTAIRSIRNDTFLKYRLISDRKSITSLAEAIDIRMAPICCVAQGLVI